MSRGSRIIGLTGSILIHLVILLSILPIFKHQKPSPDPDEPRSVEVKLLPMHPIAEEKDKEGDGNTPKVLYPRDVAVCTGRDKTYLGVGFMWNIGSQLITYIPEFYPAYKAGMRVGDMLLDPYSEVKNGWIDFDVMRHTEHFHFHIKADNICFNEG